MVAVVNSEMSVYSNETTRRYIPEGSKLYTRGRENLTSHEVSNVGNRERIMCICLHISMYLRVCLHM
jgi:hypothetical protein